MTEPKSESKVNYKLESLKLTEMLQKTLKELSFLKKEDQKNRINLQKIRFNCQQKEIRIKMLENELNIQIDQRKKIETDYTLMYNKLTQLEKQFEIKNKEENQNKQRNANHLYNRQIANEIEYYEHENVSLMKLNEQLKFEVQRLKRDNQNIAFRCEYQANIEMNRIKNEYKMNNEGSNELQHRIKQLELINYKLQLQKQQLMVLNSNNKENSKTLNNFYNQIQFSDKKQSKSFKESNNIEFLRELKQLRLQNQIITEANRELKKNCQDYEILISEYKLKIDEISTLELEFQKQISNERLIREKIARELENLQNGTITKNQYKRNMEAFQKQITKLENLLIQEKSLHDELLQTINILQKQNGELAKKIQNLIEVERAKYNKKIQQINEQSHHESQVLINQCKSEYKKVLEENQKLTDLLNKVQYENQNLIDQINKLQQESHRLMRELNKVQQFNQNITDQLQKVQQQKQKSTHSLNRLQQKNQKITNQMTRLEQQHNRLKNSRTIKQKLKDQEIINLREEYNNLLNEKEQYEQITMEQLTNLRKQVQEVNIQQKNDKQQCKRIKIEKKNLQREKLDIENNFKQFKDKYDKVVIQNNLFTKQIQNYILKDKANHKKINQITNINQKLEDDILRVSYQTEQYKLNYQQISQKYSQKQKHILYVQNQLKQQRILKSLQIQKNMKQLKNIGQFQKLLNEYEIKVSEITNELTSKQNKYEELKISYDNLKQKYDKQITQKYFAEQQIKHEKQNIQIQNLELKKVISSLEVEVDVTRQQILILNREKENQLKLINQKENQIMELALQKNKIQSEYKLSYESYGGEIMKKNLKMEQMSNQIVSLRKQILTVRQNYLSQSKKTEDLLIIQFQNSKLKDELEKLTAINKQNQRKIDEFNRKKIDETSSNKKNLKSIQQLNNKIYQAKNQQNKLQQELYKFKQQNDFIKKNIDDLNKMNEYYKIQINSLKSKNTAYIEQIEKVLKEKNVIEIELNQKIKSLNKKLEQKNQEITSKLEIQSKIQDKITYDYEKLYDEITKKQKQIEILRNSQSELLQENRKLKNDKILTLTKFDQQKNYYENNLNNFRNQQSILSEELITYRKKVEDSLNKIYDMQIAIEKYKLNQQQLINQKNLSEKELSEIKKNHGINIQNIEGKYQTKQKQCQSKEKQIQNLKKQFSIIKQENNELKNENDSKQYENQQLKSKIQILTHINQTLESQMQKIQVDLDNYKSNLDIELLSEKTKNKDLNNQVNILKSRVVQFEANVQKQLKKNNQLQKLKQNQILLIKQQINSEKNAEIKRICSEYIKNENNLQQLIQKKKEQIIEVRQKYRAEMEKNRIIIQKSAKQYDQHCKINKELNTKLQSIQKQNKLKEQSLKKNRQDTQKHTLNLEIQNRRLKAQISKNKIQMNQNKTERQYENSEIYTLKNYITRLKEQLDHKQKNQHKLTEEKKSVKEEIFYLKRELQNVKDDLTFERKRNNHLQELYQKYRNVKNLSVETCFENQKNPTSSDSRFKLSIISTEVNENKKLKPQVIKLQSGDL